MEIAIIVILLWLGFGLLLWALRESLNGVEIELHGQPPARQSTSALSPASRTQQLFQPIGRYAGRIIHEFAGIDGRGYRVECVYAWRETSTLKRHRRLVAPELVYTKHALPPELMDGAVQSSNRRR